MIEFSGEERRKYVRLPFRIAVQYQIMEGNTRKTLSDFLEGLTENVCVTGLRLEAFCDDEEIDVIMNKDITIMVKFLLPGTKRQIESETRLNYINTETKVVYLKAEHNGTKKKLLHIGLMFLGLTENDKNIISDFIRDMVIKKYKPV